jgi:hypothetical protein
MLNNEKRQSSSRKACRSRFIDRSSCLRLMVNNKAFKQDLLSAEVFSRGRIRGGRVYIERYGKYT